MTKLEIAALYAGINLLILLVLAFRVPMTRRKQQVAFLDGGNPLMTRVMRAHGNAAEYIPGAMVALLFLSLLEPVPGWLMHVLALIFTAGRLIHAYALTTYVGPPPGIGRPVGMVLTFAAYFGFAATLIWSAFAAAV